jgi:hypothetical protein
MGARIHPDARLHLVIADLVAPDRDRIVQMKAADPHVSRRRDGAALPPVREQRPRLGAIGDRGVGFDQDQPTPKRRSDRRDQKSMVAPGQAAGDGPAGITADPVGDPPFAPLRLRKVAADRACEADRTRRNDRRPGACRFAARAIRRS